MRESWLAVRVLFALVLVVPAWAQPNILFPDGTLTFFDTNVRDAAAAPGGGVWIVTPDGIARYTAAGQEAVLPTPGLEPFHLAVAADGSIWVAAVERIVRMSETGTILEQYALPAGDFAVALAVATDGALWYRRLNATNTVGRIAGGVNTELVAPGQTWSLAPAQNGDMWVLGTGIGNENEFLVRMTPSGTFTQYPLPQSTLFGGLQVVPDGTLYVTVGLEHGVLRLAPGAQTFESLDIQGSGVLFDAAGNLWRAGYEAIGYTGSGGSPSFNVHLPGDHRECDERPFFLYVPVAFDPSGEVWVQVVREYGGTVGFPVPCTEPAPVLPDLIRIDAAQLLASHGPHDVPAASTVLLGMLAAALAGIAVWQVKN